MLDNTTSVVKFSCPVNVAAGLDSYSKCDGYYHPDNKKVVLVTNFSASANISAATVLFNVPSEYRPPAGVVGYGILVTSSGVKAFSLTVNTSGELKQGLGNTITSGFGIIIYTLS